MVGYLVRRLTHSAVVLLVVVSAVFFLFRLAPGDPARQLAGLGASEEAVARVRQQLGLDWPLWQQYVAYLSGLLRLDFGQSLLYGQDTMQVIVKRLPPTVALTASSLGLALAIGVPVGIASAVAPGSRVDRYGMLASVLLLSIPNFWLGLLLISAFAVQLGWLPAGGSTGIASLVLPSTAIAARLVALFARTARSSLSETLRLEYVRTAAAKGLRRHVVIVRHALRNALIPVVTLVGLQIGYLLGGSVVVETVFAYQGLGLLLITAAGARDYAVVQALTVLYVTVFLMLNLVVDVLYARLDPRVQYR